MDISLINNFDLIIFVIIGISIVFATIRGLVKSFLSFFAWVSMVILTIDLYPHLNHGLEPIIKHDLFRSMVSGMFLSISLLVLITLINSQIIKLLDNICESAFDRVLGIGFGAVRGFVLASVVFFILSVVFLAFGNNQKPDWFIKSLSYKPLKQTTVYLVSYFADEDTQNELVEFLTKKTNQMYKEDSEYEKFKLFIEE